MEEKVKAQKKISVISENDPKRFEVLKDGWIRDCLEGIDRGPDAPNLLNRKDAEVYCKSLGARLETDKEMESLIDRSKDPCIVSNYPGKIRTEGCYWTGTQCPWNSGASFVVSFGSGGVNDRNVSYKFYVRPVRASQ